MIMTIVNSNQIDNCKERLSLRKYWYRRNEVELNQTRKRLKVKLNQTRKCQIFGDLKITTIYTRVGR